MFQDWPANGSLLYQFRMLPALLFSCNCINFMLDLTPESAQLHATLVPFIVQYCAVENVKRTLRTSTRRLHLDYQLQGPPKASNDLPELRGACSQATPGSACGHVVKTMPAMPMENDSLSLSPSLSLSLVLGCPMQVCEKYVCNVTVTVTVLPRCCRVNSHSL